MLANNGYQQLTNNMITQTQFTQYYLDDLKSPDTLHGRTQPKVSRIHQWQQMQSRIVNQPITIDLTQTNRTVWFWSDQHIGHSNIIKYTNRPYQDVHQMNKAMINNYNNTVGDDDIVLFVGDFGFMKPDQLNQILYGMRGYKILIVGNHDIDRKTGKVYDLKFDEIHMCYIITINDSVLPWHLLLTHYPLTNIPSRCVNIHGHIHEKLSDNKRHVNACVEHNNFTPVNLTQMVPTLRKLASEE